MARSPIHPARSRSSLAATAAARAFRSHERGYGAATGPTLEGTMSTEERTRDPREAAPAPPFPEQEQAPPGFESEMEPAPDFGEHSYVGTRKLRDKAAIVTGGGSGIGRAVAVAFAREGADVLISYLEEDADASETIRVVEESGRKGVAVRGDLSDEAHCREIVGRALAEFGHLELLVNNAAYQMSRASITEIPAEELEFVFRTNILAMFHLCKAAIPHMPPGSAIINTASIQAYEPSPELLHYATTKGAIVTFTKGLAKELVEKGIRVNAVAPGPVWTPLIAMSFPGDKVAQFGEHSPMGRPAQPVELAPLYVFLASDDSRYVVGEVIGATGGQLLP
jgi:NAD(P)-dependent dehydrogenase (short-subunit alcohol dehydrogenase family)